MAADLCRKFEGLSLKPYLCPAGRPTIGYGSTRYADGKAVSMNDKPISRRDADELLMTTLRQEHLPGVLRASPGLESNPYALAALVDFAYNLGVSQYRYSKLRDRVNACDWDSAKVELGRWVFGGGKKLPGLIARREAEAALLAKATTIQQP